MGKLVIYSMYIIWKIFLPSPTNFIYFNSLYFRYYPYTTHTTYEYHQYKKN
jgi:hypothetical protein